MNNVFVEVCPSVTPGEYYACFQGKTDLFGRGSTVESAVIEMLQKHPDQVPVSIADMERLTHLGEGTSDVRSALAQEAKHLTAQGVCLSIQFLPAETRYRSRFSG